MRDPLPTYRPTGSALHSARAGVAAAYCAAPCVAALLLDSPLMLAGVLAGVIAAGASAGVATELRRAARLAVPLALLVALINPLVSRRGLTVLTDGPVVPLLGNLDITLEALVYGGVAALRVLVVVFSAALFSAAVDTDALLSLLRRVAPGSALTASLATRLIPVLGRDAARLSEAYVLRAGTGAGSGRKPLGQRLRRGTILTRALAAGALERSVDLAAALEVRGYARRGARVPARRAPLPWSLHDLGFAAAAAAAAALSVAAALTGVAGFEPYPLLALQSGLPDLLAAAALPAAMLAPFGAAEVARA